MTPEQVLTKIPKDILILNWMWNLGSGVEGAEGSGEKHEINFAKWGFQQIPTSIIFLHAVRVWRVAP